MSVISNILRRYLEHAAEFRRWASQAGAATPELEAAADALLHVNRSLKAALEKLGGDLPSIEGEPR